MRDIQALSSEIKSRIKSDTGKYYVLLDELQYTITKDELKNKEKPLRIYGLLNSLMYMLLEVAQCFFRKMRCTRKQKTILSSLMRELMVIPIKFRKKGVSS